MDFFTVCPAKIMNIFTIFIAGWENSFGKFVYNIRAAFTNG
jgi:hypothetical protein